MDFTATFFSFRGRLRRRDWWLGSIAVFVVGFVLTLILSTLLSGTPLGVFTPDDAAAAEPQMRFLTIALTLLTLWPTLALAAKRAHDRNQGAASVIALLVASNVWDLATVLIGTEVSGLTGGLIGRLITGIIGLYLLVVLGFLDGTPGPNRFGRSPKGVGGDPADEAAKVFS